jgi:arginine deiminase
MEYYKQKKVQRHIIVQELPYTPESFIHLDMVFTFLDRNQCMVYEPLILHPTRYLTIHINIYNGRVKSIREVENITTILKELGMDMETLYCGGRRDSMIQEREQWHSGANFFAIAPGKVIGYGRNVNTIEEMNRNGFEVIKANDVIQNKVDIKNYSKYVITIDGSELSRGGGGCRCMTMPVRRKAVDW